MGPMARHAQPDPAAAYPADPPNGAGAGDPAPRADGTLPVPGPSPENEARKRAELRRSKAFATGLLIAATLIYLGCRWAEASAHAAGARPEAWVGYVRAAAEAGMVGALADWFAVTALFRHPMGIPIPHTAIIRRKKDQVGAALADFIGANFLNPALIVDKVRQADIPERVGEWLTEPGHPEQVSAEVGRFLGNALEAMDPADAELIIRTGLIDRLAEPAWGPPAGRALAQLIEEGRTEPVIQQLAEWLHRKAIGAGPLIDRVLGERAPSWAPAFVNDLIGERVHRELVDFARGVRLDPEHEARAAIRRFLARLARDLQEDPETMARVEELKAELMDSRPVTAAPERIWAATAGAVVAAARDPESLLRRKIAEAAGAYGARLRAEGELRAAIDRRIESAVHFIAVNYGGEVTSIISETVERWDADEASSKIELMVGRDLQFIRVNGTVVGSLAGLAIYTASTLLFGG